ncbi:MAG TPA: isoprenylcysteine carboxylmethyltransferase family protein [Tepidisphaeraceae bacterium]
MRFNTSPNSWPSLLIGLIMLAYWLRVLQMVARTRRTVGRAANLVPPEGLGRLLRVVWGPVVVLWVFVPLLTPFIENPPPLLRPLGAVSGNVYLAWLAVAVAMAAFAGTWVCWRRMGRSWRMGIDPNERTQLIFNGPYAYVRHPIYALSSLLMLTTVVVVCSPLMIVVGALHLVLLQWEARREERSLAVLHGAAYTSYTAHVGRFLPRITGRRTSMS